MFVCRGAVSLLIGRPEAKQNGPGSHRGPGLKQEACGCDGEIGETMRKEYSLTNIEQAAAWQKILLEVILKQLYLKHI